MTHNSRPDRCKCCTDERKQDEKLHSEIFCQHSNSHLIKWDQEVYAALLVPVCDNELKCSKSLDRICK